MFRVAVADLIGGLPLMKVSDRLTDIAELIVQETLVLARSQIDGAGTACRATRTRAGTARVANMIVVAYGKLGGLELGYGSDLDLVFLHDSSGEAQRTDGPQPIDNTLFFQRLGQRLVHLLTVHSVVGPPVRSRYAAAARGQSRPAGAVARGVSRLRVSGCLDLGAPVAAARPRHRRRAASCASSSKPRASKCCARP